MWYRCFSIADVGGLLLAESRCETEWALAQARGQRTLTRWASGRQQLGINRCDILTAVLGDDSQVVYLTTNAETIDRILATARQGPIVVGLTTTNLGRTLWFEPGDPGEPSREQQRTKIRVPNWKAWQDTAG